MHCYFIVAVNPSGLYGSLNSCPNSLTLRLHVGFKATVSVVFLDVPWLDVGCPGLEGIILRVFATTCHPVSVSVTAALSLVLTLFLATGLSGSLSTGSFIHPFGVCWRAALMVVFPLFSRKHATEESHAGKENMQVLKKILHACLHRYRYRDRNRDVGGSRFVSSILTLGRKRRGKLIVTHSVFLIIVRQPFLFFCVNVAFR